MAKTLREPAREVLSVRLSRTLLRALAARARKDRVSQTRVVEVALRVHLQVPSYVTREYQAAQRGKKEA